MKAGLPLVALLDEGTPVLAAEAFEAAGHRAIRHGDVLSPGAPDNLVAAAAILNNAVLIAMDRDMRQMARRFGNPHEGGRYKDLCLIFCHCNGVLAPKRVAHLMSFIEHEWAYACARMSHRLWVEIDAHYFKSYR